ncbi:Putative Ig domain-containing protein [Prosthecobacter debontii]|uniref:Putative Ig domain-containing protein n=1 Tax=Prosthecobacter debontii TaxID=48467 RepID=A0A1T4Z0A0_9BACT|nr:GEVED domain-containing protein [Prosthecobacter debontii]SKB07238.1 Putative Ig domain-containing protein [Prosthecobacter debontii]
MSQRPRPSTSSHGGFRLPWFWRCFGALAVAYLMMAGAAMGQTYDFGDYNAFSSASSTRNSNLYIGATVDAENTAQTNATATGDDLNGTDDEDGVTVPASVQRGESSSLKVVVTNKRGSTSYLHAWIDWNNNGSLTDSGEQIASNVSISNGTSNSTKTLNFTVPSTATLGDVGVRVRLTSGSSPGPTGLDGSGEVEDYLMTVGTNLSIGNLVWNDANDNGLYDNGESGISNVLVELWSPGADNAIGGTSGNADTKVASTTTTNGGAYSFTGVTAGKYFVKVPTPPLSRSSSVVDGADNGDDNDNDGSQPGGSGTSAYSGVFTIAAGTEPGSSGGGNAETTIDFGFVSNVGAPFVCDNRFYIMQNWEPVPGSGNWDTSLNYIDTDQSIVPIFIFTGKKLNGLVAYGGYLYCVDQAGGHLYRINSLGTLVDMGEIEGLPNSATDGQWGGGTALTNGTMIINRYTFSNSRTTLYFIDLGSASLIGSAVSTRYASTGSYTTGNFGDIVWDPLTDKVYGYNTYDSSNLGLFEINTSTGYCTRVASSYLSTFGSLTIDANGLAYGYGSASSSTSQDTLYVFNRTDGVLNGTMTAVGTGPVVTNSDGAACPGAAPSMKIGNLVWNDVNNNGAKDSGEAGIDGVTMKLFLGGEDPTTATPAATTTTSGGGLYTFSDLSPGQYFVYIQTPPASYPLSSSVTDTADNSQDNDDNGIQTAAGQPVRSPLISLVAGTESTSDGDSDSNTDLTIDFGFRACPTVTPSGSPTAATVGSAYSFTLSATGGTSPYTWAVASGSLPAGLTLSSAGVISGTPTTPNTSGVSLTVRATDALGCSGTLTISIVVQPNTDFGDYTSFPSASSVVTTNLRIGALVDAEVSATTNSTATGDDITGSDDEDGVTVPSNFERGTSSSISVTVTNSTGSTAYLNAWVDFNRNGSLADSGEQVATNVSVATGSSNSVRTITFTVPSGASLGASAVRVRLTSVSSPGPDGADGNGEVEDHAATIGLPVNDFGDYSGFASVSNVANTNLRFGASVDTEGTATTNATATGDDITGTDDEDGVTFDSMTAGQTVTVPVIVTNLTGSTAYLNAWIDFNNDGDVLDTGEEIVTNRSIANSTNGATINVTFDVPANAVTATPVGARFRLTSAASPGSTGTGTTGEVEDYVVTILAPITDFGDWTGGGSVSNTADTRLRLGATVDAEYSATTNASATGDDLTGVDDEDGVTIPALTAGGPATLVINRTNTTGAIAYLNAWIDYNNNGVFTDAGEQVIVNTSVANGTSDASANFSITVPASAVTGTALGARFRITSQSNPGASGIGGVGEVEDYVVTIAQPTTDFGDYSSLGAASSVVVTGLRIGATVDVEYAGTTNTTATGDDITGTDDEDGVTLPSMIAGAPATIPVVVTNTTGSTAYLNVWMDFNGNGSLTDAGEQIATNVAVTTGSSNLTRNISFTVPATSLTGVNLGVRVRLTSTASAASTGAAGNGEVEDYVAMVSAPTTDFGDYSGFADASQGVSSTLRMGASVDAEYVSTLNSTATGDDLTGIDDEDGITLPALTAGAPATITASVTNSSGATGYLNAWIDYNNNGVLTDSGEQIASNISVASGTTNGTVTLNITVPVGATTGTPLGARFRLSAPLSPGPVGANAAVGEVEDYVVTIAAPTTDFGDASGLGSASSLVTNLMLGSKVDAEYAATTNAAATGDDITGIDDEDGVTMPTSIDPGASVTLPVTVTNGSGTNAYLHAWIDFNNDGALNNALVTAGGERLEAARMIPKTTRGTILLEWWLGIGGTAVSDLTSNAAYPNSPTGSEQRTSFEARTDWENNMGQRMRGWVYPPVTGQYTFWVAGDDETQLFLSTDDTPANATMIANVPGWTSSRAWTTYSQQKSVSITLQAGRAYYIEALMKEGGGGDNLAAAWEIPGTGSGPVVIDGQYLSPWSSADASVSTEQITFTVPANASPGTGRAVRFRLTNLDTTTGTGASGNGEVEDYVVTITSPVNDFGDHSGLGSASNAASNNLRLGATVDAEVSATTNATATGDDITGIDDEDGVTLPTMTDGQTLTVPVIVTNTSGSAAYLNAWIDFNNNGSLTDSGEQVISNLSVANGSSNVTLNPSVTVPTTAVTGSSLAVRFRLTAVSSPGATGALASIGEVEDYGVTIQVPTTDFGDYSGFGSASSIRDMALRFGANVDTEYAPTSNATATGDDTTGIDDEDGVTMPALMAGAPANIPVVVTNTTGATAYANVWIDYNNNGVLTDPGEQIAADVVVPTGITNAAGNLPFTVAADAVTGANLGVRFRLTSVPNPGPTGAAGIGEVEDYVVNIAVPPSDYGDWSGVADAYSTAIAGLRLGSLVDTEFTSTRNATANGDDITGADDEDGVTLPAFTAGGPATISVVVTNTTGSTAYLNAWMDFNNNGSFTDAGEQIATNTAITTGVTGLTRTLSFTVPTTAVTGTTIGLRFRLTDVSNPGSVGGAGSGEVEDYTTTIAMPITDFGDWSGAGDAWSTASNNLRLGALADTEYASTLNEAATGDDATGSDDEDGVTLPSSLNLASSGTLTAVLTNNSGSSGYLNAWVDFNGNGSFGDSGEQIITNSLISNGTNGASRGFNFSAPSNAIPGERGVRVRLTSVQNPGPTGGAGTGEVEDYLITINCPQISISPSSLTTPVIGSSYNQSFTANGGTGPYTFTVSSGSLPDGLNLSSSGVLSGIATSTTTVGFVVTATDVNGCFITQSYTVTPVCPAIPLSPSSVMNPTVGSSYSQTITASGGTAPYTFALTNGSLPPGLTLGSSTGTISGTTTQAGAVTFTLRVTDFYGCSATQNYSMTPSCPTVTLTPSSVSAGAVGTAYSQTFTASGGVAPYSYVISSGTLPAGLSLSSGGVLGGTPTAGNGSGTAFIVRATDSRGCSGTRAYSLKICPVVSLSPETLPTLTVGTSYSQTITAGDGTAPYTFSVVSGSLPNSFSLNSSTGVISGTPSNTSASTFTIRATDANSCTGTRSYTLQPVCPTLSITTSSLAIGLVGSSYSQTLAVSGGTANYTWSLASGTLPNGLSLNSGTGQITGTPAAGNGSGSSLTFRVTDQYGCSGTATLTLQICPVISLTPTSLTAPRTATAYTETVTASGGVSPYTFTLSSGSLPAGLSLSSAGVISGTPTSTASASFIIRATDANGCNGTRAYSLTPSCAVIAVSTNSVPTAYLNTSYSTTLAAGPGTTPFTWTLNSGTLPVGLSLSTAGVISGTPTALGSSTVSVRVTDANGCTATGSLSLTVKGMTLGNLVWLDNDNDGVKDAGENGVAGAVVQLFSTGTDNAIGGTGSAADTQVGSSITTTSNGLYSFTNLTPGRYYVKVTAPAGYTHASGTPATTDNNVDNNNDGTLTSGVGTVLISPVINLQPGTESITDGDTDADTNLTVDFGLWAPMAVGNMLFADINKDGWMNANEGLENVFIQIFAEGANVNTDAAVSAAITDVKGRYIITGLNPGRYFLHLAAIQFDQGGVLECYIPMGSVVAGDDDKGQDLQFTNTPAVAGASTAVFSLLPGQLPAGNAESGIEGTTDDEGMTDGLSVDANTDMTLDLGLDCLDCAGAALSERETAVLGQSLMAASPSESASPTTFASWQAANPLGGANGALDNPDGDLYPNLLEYALGTNPADGTSGAGRFRMETQSLTGTVDITVLQAGSTGQDISLTLEASSDGQQWVASRVAPERTYNQAGQLVLRYAQVDSTLFAGAAQGMIRLRVNLDADLNGTPEASATAPAWMFSRETFPVGTRTFSMPLEQPELYAGTVIGREGETSLRLSGLSGLTLTGPTVLEILEGASSGQRFTVTDIAGGLVQTAEPLPTGLAGARVAMRRLWTVEQLLPAESFVAGDAAETADRVLYYDAETNDFVPVWLSASGWVHPAKGVFVPASGQGLLVQTRSQEVTTLVVGQMPQVAASLPPKSGTRFLGLTQVMESSPALLKLTASAGYPANSDPASATRLRLLKADAGGSESGYESYYLHANGEDSAWLREGDASGLDLSQEKLLKPFRAFFLVQP